MWPFRRKAPPKPPIDPLNEDWAVGDLAECLTDEWPLAKIHPDKGDILTVTDVAVGNVIGHAGMRGWGLWFSISNEGFYHTGFRKVQPLSDKESFSITAKIKRCKPAREPA